MATRVLEVFQNYSLIELLLIIIERKFKLRLPISSKLRWKLNIKSEIRFWDKCVKTDGLIWPLEYKLRFDPNLPLQTEIAKLLPNSKEVNILDVGAGPFTYLGKIYEDVKLNIIAVDPLADEYDKILFKYSVSPLVHTKKLEAEKLTTKFNKNHFDLVFARNCIDHAYSPENAILEMLEVVKNKHYVLLMHRPNEAEHENWQGLHQWNFSIENEDFVISSKNFRVNFSEKYKNLFDTRCKYEEDDNMIYTYILKK